jgi:hypothetical protein
VLASQETDKILMTFSGIEIDTGFYSNEIEISGLDVASQTIPVVMHVYTDVGLNDYTYQDNNIKVFPNPFSDEINFIIQDSKNKRIKLSVFNQTGQLVYHEKLLSKEDEIRFYWTDTKSPKGFYFYQIVIDDLDILTGKILKQ